MGSKFFSEPRALLLKISLPTEGITKTVLIGFNATLADVREKLLSKLSSFQKPTDIQNYAFVLTKNIDQIWLDDKVTLKAYNVKDGDMLEFKRKVKVLSKVSKAGLGPWKKAAPTSGAIYEHQLDRPVSPEPKPDSSPSLAPRVKTSTDMLFDQLYEEKQNPAAPEPRPATANLATTSSPFNGPKPRRNSVSRRKSNSLVSLLSKSSSKSHISKPDTPTPKPSKKDKKISSTEATKLNPTLPVSPPPVTIQPRAVSPSPATQKHKKDEITEEEMVAWLEMEEKDSKDKKDTKGKVEEKRNTPPAIVSSFHHDTQEISLDFSSNHHNTTQTSEPLAPLPELALDTEPRNDFKHTNYSTKADEREEDLEEEATPSEELDFHAQMQKLEKEFAERSAPSTPRNLVESSDSNVSETDGYVRNQISRIEDSEARDRKSRRRTRGNSDARLSLMIKRTNEMEMQFNTYISSLTEQIENNEKIIDLVQSLLLQMVKRIDEGQMDVKGARRYAQKAIDVIVADAKKKKNNEI